jgi:hypothetical protein
MKNLLASKTIRAVIIILGGLIILFLVFGLGVSVGYRRAGFAANFDQNYYHDFYGTTSTGPAGMGGRVMMAIHGIAGTVIDVGSTTLSVSDSDTDEESVEVSSDTVIREGENTIMIGNIATGDHVAVIGSPNDQGQVVARFIRVFPASMPAPTSTQ